MSPNTYVTKKRKKKKEKKSLSVTPTRLNSGLFDVSQLFWERDYLLAIGEEWSWFHAGTLHQSEDTTTMRLSGPAKLLDR